MGVGCATKGPNSEFVRTVTFSALQTFDYKRSLISGMEFRDSEKMLLRDLSEQVTIDLFQQRGFERDQENPDFFVVVKWRKAVSSQPDLFDSIDGPLETMNRRESPGLQFASRYHLIVEAYETENEQVFWRKELPNIFDAIQLTEERVTDSLSRALENFPQRVEKDPSLPDLE